MAVVYDIVYMILLYCVYLCIQDVISFVRQWTMFDTSSRDYTAKAYSFFGTQQLTVSVKHLNIFSNDCLVCKLQLAKLISTYNFC